MLPLPARARASKSCIIVQTFRRSLGFTVATSLPRAPKKSWSAKAQETLSLMEDFLEFSSNGSGAPHFEVRSFPWQTQPSISKRPAIAFQVITRLVRRQFRHGVPNWTAFRQA